MIDNATCFQRLQKHANTITIIFIRGCGFVHNGKIPPCQVGAAHEPPYSFELRPFAVWYTGMSACCHCATLSGRVFAFLGGVGGRGKSDEENIIRSERSGCRSPFMSMLLVFETDNLTIYLPDGKFLPIPPHFSRSVNALR